MNTDILATVTAFADNVLAHGRDTYGPTHTPLFVDGVDVRTRAPVTWRHPDGHAWVLSNFASQQILLRSLAGLSALTGQSRYRDAAAEATQYALEHLWWGQQGSRFLAWGGHEAYNASEDVIAAIPGKGGQHEMKNHYPFFEFLWQVDARATKEVIEHFWNAHIIDWGTLDFNRHGAYRSIGPLWDHAYTGGPVFFWGQGLTFLNTASDLVMAAALLSHASGDQRPLVWAERLAHRYVETRHPKTGLGGFTFSQLADAWCDGPDVRGDRAQYQYGDLLPGHHVVEGSLFIPYDLAHEMPPRLAYLTLPTLIGRAGAGLQRIAVEDLTAWARSAFREADASFIPMLTDGTVMEGLVVPKPGYFGPKGRVVSAFPAGPRELWAYTLAFEAARTPLLWNTARSIARANHLGEIGVEPGTPSRLEGASCSHPEALLALLTLWRATGQQAYLDGAARVGRNVVANHFHGGFFTRGPEYVFAKFDSVEALALLHLAAALEGAPELVPAYTGGEAFYAVDYGRSVHEVYDTFLYNRTA